MPARRKTGLALLALLSIAGMARAEPFAVQAQIARCTSQAHANLRGVAALSRACPGVDAALSQPRLTAFLPPDWRKSLTASGLGDLAALAQRYGGEAASRAPPTASLRSIAAGLVPPPQPASWSQRISAWIQRQAGSLLDRLGKWLRSLGPPDGRSARARTLLYGLLIGLLLVVVIALLILELRGTGRWLRQLSAKRHPPRSTVGANSMQLAEPEWCQPDWAGLRAHPARVLRLLVETLTRARRLERDRHLTYRELQMEARFDSELERAGFGRIALLAERELYGPPGPALLSEGVLRDAQALHAGLLTAIVRGGGEIQG
jgi:hypothetical protein